MRRPSTITRSIAFLRATSAVSLACLAALSGTALLGAACKGQMAKIERLKTGLIEEEQGTIDSALDGVPRCPDTPSEALAPGQASARDKGCLSDIANAFGSKNGFNAMPVDQAAAATAASAILREQRGDLVAHSDAWLSVVKTGKGTGIDVLRLAIARRMQQVQGKVGRHIETEQEAVETLKAIGSAIPGACPTYVLLGNGTPASGLAAPLSAEHSACVQHDLARREGMGPSYGAGVFRALEGSLALWRETERALRVGLPHMGEETKKVFQENLKQIERATALIDAKKLPGARSQAAMDMLSEVHADAGVVLFRDGGVVEGGLEDLRHLKLKKPIE